MDLSSHLTDMGILHSQNLSKYSKWEFVRNQIVYVTLKLKKKSAGSFGQGKGFSKKISWDFSPKSSILNSYQNEKAAMFENICY